jgi:hypothetical protein
MRRYGGALRYARDACRPARLHRGGTCCEDAARRDSWQDEAMRVVVALVAAGSLAVLIALAAPSRRPADPPARAPATVDVKALVREAQRVQRADALAWSRFRFHRTIQAERLDAAGAVLQTSRLEFEIMPMTVGGFDERLLRIDGREPTAEEVTRYREDASFSRHYGTLTTVDNQGDEEGGYSLATLLRMSEYKYIGIETAGDTTAHRLDFEPDPVPHGSGVAARVTQSMAGSLWLTVEGTHLVRAHAATVQPVSLYLGLGKVHSLEVMLEAVPAGSMAPGVFLPKSLTINTNLRILFTNQHRRRTFSYAGYALVASPSASPDASTSGAAPAPSTGPSGGGS